MSSSFGSGTCPNERGGGGGGGEGAASSGGGGGGGNSSGSGGGGWSGGGGGGAGCEELEALKARGASGTPAIGVAVAESVGLIGGVDTFCGRAGVEGTLDALLGEPECALGFQRYLLCCASW